MGAGKSTVGRVLASMLGWQFQDADAVLSERCGTTIAGLFEQHGEPHFRKLEAALVADLLTTETRSVLSLGGGAVEHEETRRKLAESSGSLVVYLQVPLGIAVDRCRLEPGAALRPVLQDTPLLNERYQRRLPFYEAADLVCPTAGLSPEQIAETILTALEAKDRGNAQSRKEGAPSPGVR
ncbi:shikimate kinase [Acidipila sp. EB88]|uniref:shikimate kinase n=1 Tax=Acidipila sp. EB88 TaxID=2305226 RepID=UPI00131566CD|nr:shikimate kinase [Acidipila sp. EB88]